MILCFQELELRNFISFGNSPTIIDLSEPGTISIEGYNLDQGGSNGAGKTTIINAICYALYNKPFDNISLQRLINSTNATKNTLMEVRLTFLKGHDEYVIHRTRGEQYSISILKNGEDITPGKGVTECDALIESIIGISYDLFTKTVIFSGNAQAFLQLPISQQRQQIEELFNITLLSEKAQKLKEIIRQTESDIRVQEAIVEQQKIAVDMHATYVRDAGLRVSAWEKKRAQEIQDIENTLATIGQVDFELEQLLHDEKNVLAQEGAYLVAKLAPAKKDLSQTEKEVQRLLGENEHLQNAKCPYCSQSLADAAEKLEKVIAALEVKGQLLTEQEEAVRDITEKIQVQKQRLAEVEAAIQHPNFNQLLQARENVSLLTSKLVELKESVNPHLDALSRLEAETPQQPENGKVDELRKRLEHQNFLHRLLTNKDSFLRRRIIYKTIPFLNERINQYTKKLGLPHVVKFDADMSCTVAEFGRELDFGNLSAGEKKRVNTALALAFRDVLHHLHAKVNVLFIDELDGQLDGQGIDNVVRILKEKSRDEELAVYVISHHPNIAGRLDRAMQVTKEHGFSTITYP